MRFLFVGPELCPLGPHSIPNIRLLSDSTSQWTPLPLANGSCYRVRSGLSPPSYRPCRAHTKSTVALFISNCAFFMLGAITSNHCTEYASYVCANATHLSRFRAMVLITSSITMGFDRCPFIPASKDACTSSAKALAVIAMIGIWAASGRFCILRMAFVAS